MRAWPATILLALLAAGGLHAAKPVPPGDRPADNPMEARESWRGQGISLCVAALRPVPELSPDDLESICGCAVSRYLYRTGATPPAPLENGRLPTAMRSQMISCTGQVRPERMGDVARLTMAGPAAPAPVVPPAVVAPSADAPKPLDDSNVPADTDTSSESGGGFWAWLGNLGWPAWLTGASILWWVALGIFLFGLLVLKVRRRDPRNDLVGPPSHMRRGAPLQPPRRPDLPR